MSANEGAKGLRAGVERRSALPLTFLNGLPRWTLPIALAALLIMGLVMSGWPAGIPSLLLTLTLAWFAYLSWPALDLRGRFLRIAGLVVLLAFVGGHISGQF